MLWSLPVRLRALSDSAIVVSLVPRPDINKPIRNISKLLFLIIFHFKTSGRCCWYTLYNKKYLRYHIPGIRCYKKSEPVKVSRHRIYMILKNGQTSTLRLKLAHVYIFIHINSPISLHFYLHKESLTSLLSTSFMLPVLYPEGQGLHI